jgi:hypothetical protein
MRITRAWCVELQEVVPIDVARRAFLSLDPPLARFNFLCSNKACRDAQVRVIGANYKKAAEDGVKFQAAHYKHWHGDTHLPSCEWILEEAGDGGLPGETEEATRQRRLRRKLTDFVTTFDPRLGDDTTGGGGGNHPGEPGEPGVDGSTRARGPREPNDEPGETRSRDLGRLVNNYREAKETLTRDELDSLKIRIVDVGSMRLVDYFVPVTRALHHPGQRVLYGGARFVQDYGQGFKLGFYDEVNGKPVNLYISTELMAAYRFRKYVRDIVDQIPQRRYVTVYAIGRLQENASGKRRDLIVDDLRQLALILGPLRTKADPAVVVDESNAAAS